MSNRDPYSDKLLYFRIRVSLAYSGASGHLDLSLVL